MDNTAYKPLDVKILQGKKHIAISSEEALQDVVPIEWGEDVISGNAKVLLVENN